MITPQASAAHGSGARGAFGIVWLGAAVTPGL